MEASSSSSFSEKWQVFVSFRGEETWNNFTSHLEAALRRRSINAYIDRTKMRAGDGISLALKEAIKGSRFALVVLSKDYATSAWCLDELSWILECEQNNGQVVIPIFYHVVPSDVRYQKASFIDAFDKHLNSTWVSDDQVENWRTALNKVAGISGHHCFDNRSGISEYDFVQKIAKDISSRLVLSFGSSNNFPNLVGIKSRIEQVTSLLHLESNEEIKVGIWGMGGIGKTTLARAVFRQISYQFDDCHIIDNVRDNFGKHDGQIYLQNKVASLILGEECQEISSIIQNRLHCKKLLIVLDNVSEPSHLDFLRSGKCFGDGSRIIITSRNKQVLQQVVDINKIYEVRELINGEDLQLFNMHAFENGSPTVDFEELSNELLNCAKGVPLAIRAMGFALKGKSCSEMTSFLQKLKETQDQGIHERLKISYDDLDSQQKGLFLDIACFFRGKEKAFVSEICGASADHDVGVLKDNSLIVVTERKFVEMHDLLQEMGREIVHQQSVEPGERTRLWKPEDVCDVLVNNTGTKAVQGMVLNMSEMRELRITPTTLKRMNNLRILNFHNDYSTLDRTPWKVKAGDLSSLSSKLNYLRWDKFPFKRLPLNFSAKNLVQLILPFSKLKKLWDGVQNLENLKRINLRGSKKLLEIPNLTQAKCLEHIDLSYCSRVAEIVSIEHLEQLKFLELSECKRLRNLPNCTALTSLHTLDLEHCSGITEFPEISESIKKLNLRGTGIESVSASIGGFSSLEYLDLKHCQSLRTVPKSICQLKALEDKEIILSSFSNLKSSEELLGSVECLNIERSRYKVSIEEIGFVVIFIDTNSKETNCFGICISQMKSLKELQCNMELPGVLLPTLKESESLKSVSVESCKLIKFPKFLTGMRSLEDLMLHYNNFEEVPKSIENLSELKKLDLSFNNRLKSLPELPKGLKYLRVDFCSSLALTSTLRTVSASVRRITFIDCLNLNTVRLENEAEDIILQRAQRDVKLCAKGCTNNEPLFIIYPGREIPKWFSDSLESNITIELPPHYRDNKFVGIAFVAIFKLRSNDLDFGVKCEFKSDSGVCHQVDVPLVMSGEIMKGFSGDDHVVMGYSCRWHCELFKFGESVKKASFSFSITSKGERKENKIKKCGVCLLYKKDPQPPPKRMKHG